MSKLIEFSIFLILQSFFINGVKYCFDKGGIFYKMAPSFFEINKGRTWAYPIYSCVRCMGGLWGAFTFLPAAIIMHGYCWQQIPLLFFDMGCLISINFLIYKKL